MRDTSLRLPDGFTLLETVVATAILVTALAGIAQLFVLGVRFTRTSGSHGAALLGAQAKLEALRALPLAYGSAGEIVTDPALAESPATALQEDLAGYVDSLDASGRSVDTDAGEVVFVRRWAITPIDDLEPDTLAIEVCVFRAPARHARPATAEVCVSTIRSRQP